MGDFHHTIEQTGDCAVILLGTDGDVQNWDKRAESVKGYVAGDVLGKNFRLFYTERDILDGKPEQLLKQALRNGSASDEGWMLRKNGNIFWGNVVITAIREADGCVCGFKKTVRDFTERWLSEEYRKGAVLQ